LNQDDALTVGDLWSYTRLKSTARVLQLLLRALQNARGNQCVSKRTVTERDKNTYHVGDINQAGYEACVALLDVARNRDATVRYGAFPRRLATRSYGSKHCGCHRSESDCIGRCVWSDGLCVPRASNARGFSSVSPTPSQVEPFSELARVRRNSTTRRTTSLLRDRDSLQDLINGHDPRIRYARRASKLWRHPSRRVRSSLTS